MTKNTLLAIAAFAASIATTAKTLAEDISPDGDLSNTPAPEEKTPRRGRGPAKQLETPPAGDTTTAGKPESELRELIKPLVEDQGRGAEVKAILTRLGAESLSKLPPEKHAEFVRSIEALLI